MSCPQNEWSESYEIFVWKNGRNKIRFAATPAGLFRRVTCTSWAWGCE
jgi:hypothetical protein